MLGPEPGAGLLQAGAAPLGGWRRASRRRARPRCRGSSGSAQEAQAEAAGCPAAAVAADGQHIPLRTGLAAWALEAAPREHGVTGDAGR